MSHKSLIPFLSLLLALLTVTSIYAQETAECEPGFRLFEHELLATDPLCIPEDPQRIAFIDSSIAYGVALGVESVTRSYYFDAFLGDFLGLVDKEAVNAMVDIGDTWEMNAESLLLAEPDLIVSATWWPEANEYAETIAPTVVIDHDRAETWLQSFDIITQIVGRADVQEALLADIDERLATLTELLGEEAAYTTFTVTIIESAEQLWMFTEYNFGAQLALQAGLSFADTVPTPEEAAETGDGPYAMGISIEQLRVIDAGHIFLFTNYADNAQEGLFASPIWQRFADSDPERIHFLTGEYWVRDHPIAAHRVLDDLFYYVAGVDPAEVSPNPFAYTYQLPPTEEPSAETWLCTVNSDLSNSRAGHGSA